MSAARWGLIMLWLVIPAFVLLPSPARCEQAEKKPAELKISKAEQEIIDRTNKERAKEGLVELKPNEKLFQAAREHSANMAKQGMLAHELDGTTPMDRLKKIGYKYAWMAENVAEGRGHPISHIIQLWMNSPPHRAHLMSTKSTEIGVGLAVSDNGKTYYTQVFADPLKR